MKLILKAILYTLGVLALLSVELFLVTQLSEFVTPIVGIFICGTIVVVGIFVLIYIQLRNNEKYK